jgi:hypothetical protein
MVFHSLELAKEYRGPRILHTGRKFCLWDPWFEGGGLGLELMLKFDGTVIFAFGRCTEERVADVIPNYLIFRQSSIQ